ncbi:MAG: HEAT repeat domain-containing protein [Longimicrobiales bacterium]
MQIPQRLAVQLARAYALTEILPLRHSNVQAALDELTQSVGPDGLQLQVKDEHIWVDETKVDEGEEVRDLAQGLSRCGVVSVLVGAGLESRVLGTFLDTVRIASISGHLGNLEEMVAFHGGNLQVEFGEAAVPAPELSQPAGAIFAGALAGAGLADPPADSSHGEDWDPPGAEVEPPKAESPPPKAPKAMTPAEFGKGVEFFMQGTPEQRVKWAGPLAEQASRVDGDADPGTTLDIVIELLGKPGQEAEEVVTDVASRLVRPIVARELALRLGRATDEDERGQLLQVAAQVGDAVAPAFAAELATTDDRAARRGLVHALTLLGDAALGTVDLLLSRDEWYVVRNAVTVLSVVGGADAFEKLKPCLTHSDARVRREAIMALAKLESPRAGEFLAKALSDEDADVRAAATMMAGILQIQEAAPVLRARFDLEQNEGVLIEAIRTLGKLRDGQAVGQLQARAVPSFFSRPPKAVRIAAYRALSRIRTPEAIEVLEDSKADRDPEVRTLVQDALDALS